MRFDLDNLVRLNVWLGSKRHLAVGTRKNIRGALANQNRRRRHWQAERNHNKKRHTPVRLDVSVSDGSWFHLLRTMSQTR